MFILRTVLKFPLIHVILHLSRLELIQCDDDSPSMLGFCDAEFYVPKMRKNCQGGFPFGERVPKCVCVTGIYQVVMENCDKGVGFGDVCTKTEDEATGLKVMGIQLTEDPNWDTTGIVYYRPGGVVQELLYAGEGRRDKIGGERFYTINGDAKISVTNVGGQRRQTICVERKSSTKDGKICMYRHTDNVDLWHLEGISYYTTAFSVMKPGSKCPGSGMQSLRPGKCFEPLTLFDSDCQIPCDKSNILLDTSGPDLLTRMSDMEKNCTTDSIGFFKHENSFINRQLRMYMVMDQIKNDSVNISTPVLDAEKFPGINRTYQMYDVIYDIAYRSCNFTFIHLEVWEWASKLFMYLHRANKLMYDIPFEEEDFDWIMKILNQCSSSVTAPLKLESADHYKACTFPKRATGYCIPPRRPSDQECEYTPVKLSPMYQDFTSKHYIPEFVWLFLDIVHIQCFKDYADSYRMFHIMERAYEKLFTTPIKDYWMYATWTEQVKNSLLTVDADDIMWNAEICAESVYHLNKYKVYRLNRPMKYNYPARKKRSAEPITTSWDISCAATKNDFKMPALCNKKPVVSKDSLVKPGAVKS